MISRIFRNTVGRYLLIGLSLLVAISLSLTSCNSTSSGSVASSSTLDKITASNKAKIGYLVFPPTITKNTTTKELGGHNVDTIREIAKVNKWELEFVETDWAGFTSGLDTGRFDISIVPTFVTIPRAMSVYFTQPMFFAGNSAIIRATEARFTSLASIDKAGVTIAVTQGEAGDEYAKANFKNAKVTAFPGGDQSAAFQAVAAGRADIALGDAFATAQFTKANTAKVKDLFANDPYNLTPVSWAVKKGDDKMLNFLNSSLESLDYQGRLREWEKKAGANWLHLKKTWEFTTAKS
jgi:ABC-type amino acid transport substrate-binding protein